MLKAVLFDLDGTLLPMNEEVFTKGYFSCLCRKAAPRGYESDGLIKTVWAGTKAMVKNDGSKTNEQAFWDVFASVYGKDKLVDKELFDEFYVKEFRATAAFCGVNENAPIVVRAIRANGLKTILATNPVFPRDGMVTRMGFTGLEEKDFDYITSYEISRFSKPNPRYYEEILAENDLSADETIMFGNNEIEDYEAASACGIKTYLLGDLILRGDKPPVEPISFGDILGTVEKEIFARKDK